MMSFERWQRPMSIGCGAVPRRSPRASRSRDDRLARGVTILPGIGRAVRADRRVVLEDRDHRQAVAAADLVVGLVVGGRDLHTAGPEGRVDHLVGDDGHVTLDERDARGPADEARVARVVGMDGDPGVAEDRLGTRRRDADRLVRTRLARRRIDEVVTNRPEGAASPRSG